MFWYCKHVAVCSVQARHHRCEVGDCRFIFYFRCHPHCSVTGHYLSSKHMCEGQARPFSISWRYKHRRVRANVTIVHCLCGHSAKSAFWLHTRMLHLSATASCGCGWTILRIIQMHHAFLQTNMLSKQYEYEAICHSVHKSYSLSSGVRRSDLISSNHMMLEQLEERFSSELSFISQNI